mgnify:FL=1
MFQIPEYFLLCLNRAIHEVNMWPNKQVNLFHHNDADGLSSGAILHEALKVKGFSVNGLCLERLYPQLLEKICKDHGKILVFADFGGRNGPLMSRLNQGKNLVLILDHHPARVAEDPRVHNLDPSLYGISGDWDISASTLCALFANHLNEGSLSSVHYAVIGAVGDKCFVNGRLTGYNRKAALQAKESHQLRIKEAKEHESYECRIGQKRIDCTRLAFLLDCLGGVGYFQNGPDKALHALLHHDMESLIDSAEYFERMRSTIFNRMERHLRSRGWTETGHIQWLHVGDGFHPMGVKSVGLFCEQWSVKDWKNSTLYLACFQNVPDFIPGFGELELDSVKVSLRVPKSCHSKLRAGKLPGIDEFLPHAAEKIGGCADACHKTKAAATLPKGSELDFIVELEKQLKKALLSFQ